MDHLVKNVLDSGYTSARIILRKLTMNDAENMFAYTSDRETCRYLGWGPHTERKQCDDFIQSAILKYQDPKDILWGVAESSDDALIGVVRIYDLTDNSATVSYILNRFYTGKGYMTEAVRAVIEVCFQQLGKEYVLACLVDGNEASRRMMERCGMQPCSGDQGMLSIKGILYKLLQYKIGRQDK